jgi:hypothetical protein
MQRRLELAPLDQKIEIANCPQGKLAVQQQS